jgi:hypothetical protein
VIEHGDAVALGQAAHRIGLAVLRRLGDGDDLTADAALAYGLAERAQDGECLQRGLGGRARLGDGDDADALQIDAVDHVLEADRIDVVDEVKARAFASHGDRRDGQGLGAERRAAGAEHDHVVEAHAKAARDGLDVGQIVTAAGDAHERQRAVVVSGLQALQRRHQGRERLLIGGLEAGKGATEVLRVGKCSHDRIK